MTSIGHNKLTEDSVLAIASTVVRARLIIRIHVKLSYMFTYPYSQVRARMNDHIPHEAMEYYYFFISNLHAGLANICP